MNRELVGWPMAENNALQVDNLAQWLLDALVATQTSGITSRGRFRVLSALRRFRLRLSDPLVRFSLGDVPLVLPLSHELPLYRRKFPQYALNLGRVAAIVHEKYPGLTMIDVGANIGDSVAVVRAFTGVPTLCVEGEDGFFRLLAANTKDFGDIELEHAFLGAGGERVSAVHLERGNARIELGRESCGATIHTFGEVVARHPRFARAKLVKLDAEGYDCKIICAAARSLECSRPVLFFEYHPPLCAAAGYDPFPVFRQLSEIGYVVAAFYENTGSYMLSLKMEQRTALEDIHRYFAGMGGFCDVVSFHAEDLDIAEALRKSEYGGDAGRANKIDSADTERMAHAV